MTIRLCLIFIVGSAIILGACSEDAGLTPFINVNDSVLMIPAPGGQSSFRVESNGKWTVSTDESWIKVGSQEWDGSQTFTFSCDESLEAHERSGNIFIDLGSIQKRIRITQAASFRIESIDWSLYNYEGGRGNDSVIVKFNQPILDAFAVPGSDFCKTYTGIKGKIKGNRFAFAYGCAQMGDSYPLTITATDEKNNAVSFKCDVPFYRTKVHLPGLITDYFIDNANANIWAVTRSPGKLLKISIPDLTILTSYDLDFDPYRVSYNAYYDRIILYCTPGTDYAYKDNIHLFNPQTGEITKIKVTPLDGGDGSKICPANFCTMKDGLGILITWNSGGFGWGFVDATQNNLMYKPSDVDEAFYRDVCITYDQSKLLLQRRYGNEPVLDFVEAGSSDIKTFVTHIGYTEWTAIVPSKKFNRVLLAQSNMQFISDLNQYTSKASYLDVWQGQADFSYRPGEEETVYYLTGSGRFRVMDHKNGFTNLLVDSNPTLTGLKSTTDGRYFMAYQMVASDLYIFDVDVVTRERTEFNSSGRINTTQRPSDSSENPWIKP